MEHLGKSIKNILSLGWKFSFPVVDLRCIVVKEQQRGTFV